MQDEAIMVSTLILLLGQEGKWKYLSYFLPLWNMMDGGNWCWTTQHADRKGKAPPILKGLTRTGCSGISPYYGGKRLISAGVLSTEGAADCLLSPS